MGGSPITLAISGINNDIVFSMEDFHGDEWSSPPKRWDRKKTSLAAKLGFFTVFHSPYMIRWLLRFNFPIGEQVIIIGGGFAGCEIGEVLVEKEESNDFRRI